MDQHLFTAQDEMWNDYRIEIAELKQQNAEMLKGLERAEQTIRNLAANLDGDLAQIARNEASNLRDDIDRAGE